MDYGFVKVAVATPVVQVGDCNYNARRTAAEMDRAQRAGAALLVLPELGLTGYTCGDLFLQHTLQQGALQALQQLCAVSIQSDMITVVGLPLAVGGKLYNCAAVLQKGCILGLVPKRNLPNYAEFYEARHFAPGPVAVWDIELLGQTVPFGGQLLFASSAKPNFTFAVEICEDLWVPAPPSIAHALAGAAVICNLSASDETVGKAEYRRQLVSSQSARLCCAYLYADAGEGESSTDMVFGGHNIIAENGTVLAETPLFENGQLAADIDLQRLWAERTRMSTYPPVDGAYRTVYFEQRPICTPLCREVERFPFVPVDSAHRARRCESILTMQAQGLKKRLLSTGCKTAVVGISGGLDSTLALLVTVRAIDLLKRPHRDITAVSMPCFGTTDRTRKNAAKLCAELGVSFREIDITAAVTGHLADLGHDPHIADITYENAQARERTQLLMDLANQTDGLVVGTGDLSELALGWATYNGDHMSMYAVNASVPKTLVRHLVSYVAEHSRKRLKSVLEDILSTPVSPELLPAKNGQIAQKTEDLVGPYALHDFFLYYVVRFGFSPAKICFLAEHAFAEEYRHETIVRWLRVFYQRFFSQQFKRSCLPDGPKVGSITLSPRGDWRMPSDASIALWKQELDAL